MKTGKYCQIMKSKKCVKYIESGEDDIRKLRELRLLKTAGTNKNETNI